MTLVFASLFFATAGFGAGAYWTRQQVKKNFKVMMMKALDDTAELLKKGLLMPPPPPEQKISIPDPDGIGRN